MALRRGGRAADCRRLESARGETLRGFKSLPRRVGTSMTLGSWVLLGVIDIGIIAGLSILIGATAPRWPDNWLSRDSWLTRSRSWETPRFFRRLRVAALANSLPEFGAMFGGRSKREVPGRDRAELSGYLIEVRRALWVHSLSMLTWIPLAFFNPWGMTLAGAVIAIVINLPFVIILRGNNARLNRMMAALDKHAGGNER